VTTSGKSIDETIPILMAQADVSVLGLIVSLNREEKALDCDRSAQAQIEEKYGFPAASIVTMSEVTEYLTSTPVDGKMIIDDSVREALDAYYRQYGAKR
jgi:orotate phosphoribosyltransferase